MEWELAAIVGDVISMSNVNVDELFRVVMDELYTFTASSAVTQQLRQSHACTMTSGPVPSRMG